MTARSKCPPAADHAGCGNALNRATPVAMILCLLGCSSAIAHGWHNAALATASLDEWTADVKAAIPEIRDALEGQGASKIESYGELGQLKEAAGDYPGKAAGGSTAKVSRARTIQVDRLTPEQQALLGRKAKDCLEIMAYMDRGNIIPVEFPKFKLSSVEDYRDAAKQLMKMMGPAGTEPLVGVIQNEMAGSGRSPLGLKRHRDYWKDLLEVLRHSAVSGDLTERDVRALLAASQGRKSARQAAFAAGVQEAALLDDVDLSTLAEVATNTADLRLRKRLGVRLRQRMTEADVLELLKLQLATDNSGLRRNVGIQLKKTAPRFAEVEPQLGEIWKLAGSDDQEVAAAARRQVANAFLQASIPDCMDWLGRGDQELNRLVREQLDFRINRARDQANAKLQTAYRQDGLTVLTDPKRTMASRAAAIAFLGRLKDHQAVGPLANVLSQLPRELWPEVGGLLRDLTGEDYGPHEGDGVDEAFEALTKWRAWWQQNREKVPPAAAKPGG